MLRLILGSIFGLLAHGLRYEYADTMMNEMEPGEDVMEEGGPGCAQATDWPEWCPQGNSKWTNDELRKAIPEFANLYKERPIGKNTGGMNANHAFALWFTIIKLKPKHIIESGVYEGQTTWLMRKAAPEAQIYSLDPRGEDQLKFRDASKKTRYFFGANFKDIGDMDWDELIPKAEKQHTLVMLDDHMNAMRRSTQILKHGFRHVWYDDNQNGNYGSDCYSFNTICSPAHGKKLLMNDVFGKVSETISAEKHQTHGKWLSSQIEEYFEFPAILDGCSDHALHKRQQSLLSNETELVALGFPEMKEEKGHYKHFYPPYVKFKQ